MSIHQLQNLPALHTSSNHSAALPLYWGLSTTLQKVARQLSPCVGLPRVGPSRGCVLQLVMTSVTSVCLSVVVYCADPNPAAGKRQCESSAWKTNVDQCLLLLQNLIVQTVSQTAQSHQCVMQLACRQSSSTDHEHQWNRWSIAATDWNSAVQYLSHFRKVEGGSRTNSLWPWTLSKHSPPKDSQIHALIYFQQYHHRSSETLVSSPFRAPLLLYNRCTYDSLPVALAT